MSEDDLNVFHFSPLQSGYAKTELPPEVLDIGDCSIFKSVMEK